MKQALKLVFGSCVVYVVMAACASKRSSNGDGDGNGNPMAGGNGGMQGVGGSVSGAMATGGGVAGTPGGAGRDAMADGPVPDAMAQDSGGSGPQVNTVPCNLMFDGSAYAEMTYPGRSRDELAPIHAYGEFRTPQQAGRYWQAPAVIDDGVARVACGVLFSAVTFVLP